MMKTAFLALAAILMAASPALADTAPAGASQTAATVRIVVPARNIARGDIVSAGDLTYANVSARRAFAGVITDPAKLAGKQARRMLRVGESVRVSDVRAPILVTKGSTVTMVFHAPGITLTAVGKAMNEGGLGEPVTVLNPVSYRQITATVTGPGTVAAGDISNTIHADAPAQLAAIQN
jgi:flagella basal body P-ring formation protein FlgA